MTEREYIPTFFPEYEIDSYIPHASEKYDVTYAMVPFNALSIIWSDKPEYKYPNDSYNGKDNLKDLQEFLKPIFGVPNAYNFLSGNYYEGILNGVHFRLIFNKQTVRPQIEAKTKEDAIYIRNVLHQQFERQYPGSLKKILFFGDIRNQTVRKFFQL